jgi:hypothetical protein
MLRRLAVLVAAVIVCAAVASADDKDKTKPGKATIEPTSLSVNRKLDPMRFPFSSPSTSVALEVRLKGKQLLLQAVDSSKSKVTEFKDDKGTDLLPKEAFFKPSFSQVQVARDRSAVVVSYYSSAAAPVKGATKVTIKGELLLVCGSEEKTTDEKEVEMKAKTEAKLGDFTIKIDTEKGFGNSGGSFTLTSDKPNFKSLQVKDADGKAVETFTFGTPYFFNKKWNMAYSLRKQVAKPKISITYYSKEETVKVPVDVSIGLGL